MVAGLSSKINYPMAHPKTKKGEMVQSVGSIVSSRPEKRAGSVTSASTPRKRRRTSEEAESDCPSAVKTQPLIPRVVDGELLQISGHKSSSD